MTDDYIVNSFTTFTTTFSATVVQVEPMLLSDIYEVSVDFAWTTTNAEKSNAAFLKMKFFLEEVLHHSILTHPKAPMKFNDVQNYRILFPFVPTNDVIALTLHAKLNAIGEENIEILSVKVGSKLSNPSITYTYGDNEYPMLPSIDELLGEGPKFHDIPWWFRETSDAFDRLAEENEDLTDCPYSDTIFIDIEKMLSGELNEKKDGEIVEIQRWKPKIIDD